MAAYQLLVEQPRQDIWPNMLSDMVVQHDIVSPGTAISKDAILRHVKSTARPNSPSIRWLTISKDFLGSSGQESALLEPLSQLHGPSRSSHDKRHISPIHNSTEATRAGFTGITLQQAPSDADVCCEAFDVGVRLSNSCRIHCLCNTTSSSAEGCCAACQQQPPSGVPDCLAGASAGRHRRTSAVTTVRTPMRRLSRRTAWFSALRKPITSLKLAAADTIGARLAAATSTSSSSLQLHKLSLKLLSMLSKSSRSAGHKDAAAHVLRPSSGKRVLQRRQRRATGVFEATGHEDIRYLLGPHAVWGSITRFKMLLLSERAHETDLQHVLSQSTHEVDWAGTPAWEDDFSSINKQYGKRVQQHLFWWGGALARQRHSDGCHDS